jgi:hypothetical protein
VVVENSCLGAEHSQAGTEINIAKLLHLHYTNECHCIVCPKPHQKNQNSRPEPRFESRGRSRVGTRPKVGAAFTRNETR